MKNSYDELLHNDKIKTLVQTLFVEYEKSDQAAFFVSFLKIVEILTQIFMRVEHRARRNSS